MKDLIKEIMCLAVQKCGISKNVVDLQYSTSINNKIHLELHVFKNGYKGSYSEKDYKEDEYYNAYIFGNSKNTTKTLSKLQEIKEYLENLEDAEND